MPRFRHALPQIADRMFLTDGGLETTVVFHEGRELPHFAAVTLHRDAEGEALLERYFGSYSAIAARHGAGFVFESATWRASPAWAEPLGVTLAEMEHLNRRAIAFLEAQRTRFDATGAPAVVSGNVGPRGDGYDATRRFTVEEAERYHAWQVGVFADTEADLVSAVTLNHVEEAIGFVRAAKAAAMPAVVSFTVETDGRLPTGQSLPDAIAETDRATGGHAAYFMVNCAHPTHFADVVAAGGAWLERIGGLRANASRCSHAELNDSPTLDSGDPRRFGQEHAELWGRLPRLSVLGGCCGTDERHVAEIAAACAPLFAAAR